MLDSFWASEASVPLSALCSPCLKMRIKHCLHHATALSVREGRKASRGGGGPSLIHEGAQNVFKQLKYRIKTD
jgi:hypothetical protein